MKLLFSCLFVSFQLFAADSGPAPSNLPGAEYPRVNADSSVTFRLKAPEAKQVKIEGGTGLLKEPATMTRSEDGVWSITTPPAGPGFHYYWFTVDGLRVNDAASSSYFGWARESSGIDIPDSEGAFYAPKEAPHGEVRSRPYFSRITGQWRRAFVYTPPDYDNNSSARYPVLYLLHGSGENERGWVEQGRANFILDNLLAAKRARPMIVVSETGYASALAPAATSSTNRNANVQRTAAFEEVMLKEIIPMIDATYRTQGDREHRAMAGLSMGAGQTISLTLRHLDQFGWIGAMSGGVGQNLDVTTAYGGAFRDANTFNKKVKLLWFGYGTAETRLQTSLNQLHETLEKAGIKHTIYSSPGTDHEWQTWRRSLNDFAPRLFQD